MQHATGETIIMCTSYPRHARRARHALPRGHPVLAALVLAAGALAILATVLVPALRQAPVSAPQAPASTPAYVHPRPPVIAPPAPARPRPAPVSRYTVRPGDSLWSVALAHYGTGRDWGRIYTANRATIGPDPGMIRPGQVLTIPRDTRQE